ncbi:deoxyhypusine synthase [Vigna unguiculata]|uniref:Deoxyhypusine synthase n=1 Tax=Vigna unguiculata TaxID=3917 RepID=A0A4D6L4L6_VIGUN|nr:deoxyhypusine synthase [Vigna unguiculata]
MATTGFQASNLSDAIQVINQMLDWRLVDEAVTEDCSDHERDLEYRKSVTCRVFMGFTSNLISFGVRDIVRFLLHHRVDVVVTTTGGIEDLIKCLAPTFIGDLSLPGAYLRSKGLNRIGGGLPKYHICNANMMRNGADYAVFINTAQEYDGSDSGARSDEAVSWGKIRGSVKTVKVHCDATIAFPLLVAETFATRVKPHH